MKDRMMARKLDEAIDIINSIGSSYDDLEEQLEIAEDKIAELQIMIEERDERILDLETQIEILTKDL